MPDEQPSSRASVTTGKPSSSLRWMVPLMIALVAVALLVLATEPKPPVPAPTPTPSPKTVAEVQQQIDAVKGSTNVPPGEKARILGFLNAQLEQAKARERGEPIPLGGPNPPAPTAPSRPPGG